MNAYKGFKRIKNCKSPRTDGLSAEFYKFFGSEICTDIIASFNFAFKSGMLSISQRRGIISLIPKKHKDKSLLENLRPIWHRLQNFDKINCEKHDRKSALKNHQP